MKWGQGSPGEVTPCDKVPPEPGTELAVWPPWGLTGGCEGGGWEVDRARSWELQARSKRQKVTERNKAGRDHHLQARAGSNLTRQK